MSVINLREIDEAFDKIKDLNKVDPDAWRQTILEQLTKNNGIDELRNLAKIKAIILNFVDDNNIYAPETISQTDRVIVNAYEFIEDLVNIVGYKKDDGSDD